ncbi:nuclear transport factor 2 family protein [Flagellimonas meishanensis]|uniref:nuclear transport factor 2 family protein n=1 Tax=Flagellimonas meishanensis TaxID=2873264 RepID=UPI001CA6533C|nr:nuclear transport factor 2 family protein [[Muricauda] meishanensis]
MRKSIVIIMSLFLALSCAKVKNGPSNETDGMDIQKAKNMVARYYGIFSQRPFSIDDLMSFYHPQVEFADPTFEIEVHGTEEVSKLYAQTGSSKSNYSNIGWNILKVITSDNNIVIHGTWSGNYLGKPFKVPFITLWEMENDLIVVQKDFFAASMWDRQVDYHATEQK